MKHTNLMSGAARALIFSRIAVLYEDESPANTRSVVLVPR